MIKAENCFGGICHSVSYTQCLPIETKYIEKDLLKEYNHLTTKSDKSWSLFAI